MDDHTDRLLHSRPRCQLQLMENFPLLVITQSRACATGHTMAMRRQMGPGRGAGTDSALRLGDI